MTHGVEESLAYLRVYGRNAKNKVPVFSRTAHIRRTRAVAHRDASRWYESGTRERPFNVCGNPFSSHSLGVTIADQASEARQIGLPDLVAKTISRGSCYRPWPCSLPCPSLRSPCPCKRMLPSLGHGGSSGEIAPRGIHVQVKS